LPNSAAFHYFIRLFMWRLNVASFIEKQKDTVVIIKSNEGVHIGVQIRVLGTLKPT
jgi:hypothetical protein